MVFFGVGCSNKNDESSKIKNKKNNDRSYACVDLLLTIRIVYETRDVCEMEACPNKRRRYY